MAEKQERLGVVQRLARWAGRKALSWSGVYSLSDPEFARRLLSSQGTYTGKAVNDQTAMQISAVWACCRIISETMGSLPVHVMRKEDGGTAVEASDHPLAEVLAGSPNADMTSPEYRETLGLGLCLAGNSFSFKETNGAGNVSSLVPLPTDGVRVERNAAGVKQFKVLDRGQWETVPAEKIWHVPGFGYNGLTGLSPIGLMRQALGLALATEEFGARFFGQGARPATIVEVPEWLDQTQRNAAYARLEKLYSGLANAHKPFILEGGMKHVNVSMPLDDAQFILTRKFQIAEICRIYRMPLHMVQEMEGSTNNNVEWIGQSLATHTLLPYFTRVEQSAGKYLFKPADRERYFLRFNYEGLLRADTPARGQFYATMLQNGVYNRNEVRALENRPRVEGLDDYTVQLNLTPADLLRAIAQTQTGTEGN
jgi:HK97 family phage portal protein